MSSTAETNPSLVKLKLLDCLRNGDSGKLDELVKICENTSNPQLGKLKNELLHFAVQIGPLSIIEYIVNKNLVDSINIQNEDENTPLHLASISGRADVITFLMNQDSINDCIVNKDGHQPIESSSNMEIVQLLSDLRTKYVEFKANELRKSFESRNFENLGKLLSDSRTKELLDINGTDPLTGDTVLLEFIKKNDLEMVRFILRNGGDPFKRNLNGKLPVDSAGTPIMRKLIKDSCNQQTMIDAANLSGVNQGAPIFKGFLKKWTNFANGYKLRWFILDSEGRLSYYKSPNDIYNTCRGMIHLSNAELRMDSSEKSKFEIILKNKNGGSPVKWHLKANHVTETNRWVWALQNAIRFQKDLGKQQSPPLQQINQHRVRPSISESDPRINDHHMRSTSIASNISISSMDSVPSSEKTKTSLYKKPFKKVSKLARRSSNNNNNIDTSNPGLKYTNFASEQKLNASSASLASPNVRDDQSSVPNKEEFYHDSEGEDEPDDDDDDDDDDEEEAEVDQEVEDLMIHKKKPNVSQLIVVRNQLNMELNSFNDFLKNSDDSISKEELIRVSQTILQNISTLIEKENNLMEKKRLKIDKIFERQHEISSIWENSIKQLELEIQDRESKICVLEDKVKILKKSIKRSFGEPVVPTATNPIENTKAVSLSPQVKDQDEEVAKILEEEDHSDDEFFDAEESDGGIIVEAPKVFSTSAVAPELPIVQEEIDEPIPETKEISEKINDEVASETTKVASKTNNAIIVNGFELKSETQLSRYKKIVDESTFKGYEDPIRSTLDKEDNRPKISLWGVLKSLVGKDMTKMTLPVSFNEPTSLLQRNTEVIEYSDLLDEAATVDDSALRMVYVAAFAASEYVSTIGRIAKPFNPLLGETYEYARPDKGYRCFLEQVSHHPPISALVAEAPSWSYYGASHVKAKFLGRSFDIQHLGTWFCEIYPDRGVIDKTGKKKDMEIYSWKKCNNSVVGIIIGNPTIDNYGEMEIRNHMTGDYMNFHFKQKGWRASSAYEVKGEIYSSDGKLKYSVGGHWNSKIYAKGPEEDAEKFLVWEANKRTDMMFHLTNFAASLNAPQPHLLPVLPCTDTRLRPDQRAMEDGDYDLAATEKNRLEEKQRAARKKIEDAQLVYTPRFFVKSSHPVTKDEYWEYNDSYWVDRKEGKLKNYRDIF